MSAASTAVNSVSLCNGSIRFRFKIWFRIYFVVIARKLHICDNLSSSLGPTLSLSNNLQISRTTGNIKPDKFERSGVLGEELKVRKHPGLFGPVYKKKIANAVSRDVVHNAAFFTLKI
jgi:hypothetical protein